MTNKYPIDDATYAIVVTATTKTGDILTLMSRLLKMNPDRVVLFSEAPHDVETRPDWELIEEVGQGPFKQFSVELLTAQQISDISANDDSVNIVI